MTGPVTPAAIAQLARAGTTSLQEAADLIQHYAEAYAACQVERAVSRISARMLMSLEMPLGRRPS